MLRVVDTWLFTWEQFKDIPVICDTITELDPVTGDRQIWTTTNNWPNFYMVKLYKVEAQNGTTEWWIERPAHNDKWHSIKSSLLKVSDEREEEIETLVYEFFEKRLLTGK